MASQIMAVIGPDYALISAGRMDEHFIVYSRATGQSSVILDAMQCRALVAAAPVTTIESDSQENGPVQIDAAAADGLFKLAGVLSTIAQLGMDKVRVALETVTRIGSDNDRWSPKAEYAITANISSDETPTVRFNIRLCASAYECNHFWLGCAFDRETVRPVCDINREPVLTCRRNIVGIAARARSQHEGRPLIIRVNAGACLEFIMAVGVQIAAIECSPTDLDPRTIDLRE